MPISMLDAVDFSKIPAIQFAVPVVSADPAVGSSFEAGLIYNSTTKELKYYNGSRWVSLGEPGTGGPPSGPATGDLSGSYPDPQIAAGVIVDADVNASANIAQSKINGLTASLSGKQSTSEKGVANGYASLDANSKIPTSQLPPLAINDVFTASSDAGMQGLTAEVGDMCIRTDTGKTYVLSASPASTLANWKEIMATGQVVSVNGQTGVVSITAASLGVVPITTQVIAGAGLTGGGALSGNVTLNVVSANTDLTIAADALTVNSAPKWTTPRSISLTGDVTGSAASVDGSGNVSIATTIAGAGTGAKHFAGDVGAGTASVITHNLNTRDVTVEVYRATTPWDTVQCTVERTTVNTVTLRFANAVSAAAYRCVVTGR